MGTVTKTVDIATDFVPELSFATSVYSSGNTRYLLDQNGEPWFGVGAAPWSLIGQLSTSDIDNYLETRAGQGYRLVMFSAPEWYHCTNAPNNFYNVNAFTGTAFQSTLNETYWATVDHAIDKAASVGITCLVCPAYWGCCMDGVQTVLTAASDAQVYTYGTYIGSRYKNRPNILWLAGHDIAVSATMKARNESLQSGIKSTGDTHLWVPGGEPFSLGTIDWGTTTCTWDIESVYDYDYNAVLNSQGGIEQGTRPVIYLEGRYEDEAGSTTAQLRSQAWGSIAGGAFCHIYGNNPEWFFGTGWESDLTQPGSLDMIHLADTLAAHPWHLTAPDLTGAFLTAGAGTGVNSAGARYGGSLALIYMPTARVVTLDLTKLTGGPFKVTRIDPADGSTSVLTTSASGSGYQIASQGSNSGSDSDWTFVIEVA